MGPTGLPYDCDGESSSSKWRVGASTGAFRTTIEFEGETEVDMEQASVSAIVGYQLSTKVGLVASVGGILGGKVKHTTSEDMGKGALASLTVTYLPLFETDTRPFLLGSFTLGGSRTNAVSDDGRRHDWTAADGRLGLMMGKTFAERYVPFVAARVFAGPVAWKLGGESASGSDVNKYTVGFGGSYRIPGKLDVFAELLALGERSASFGLSLPL